MLHMTKKNFPAPDRRLAVQCDMMAGTALYRAERTRHEVVDCSATCDRERNTVGAAVEPTHPSEEAGASQGERRALGVAYGAHGLHDAYTDLVWVALPIWQAEFGLSYASVGLLRTVYSGTLASLQIPAAALAARIGAATVLAAGTALAGLCTASPVSALSSIPVSKETPDERGLRKITSATCPAWRLAISPIRVIAADSRATF
jgi:hypothetical protein